LISPFLNSGHVGQYLGNHPHANRNHLVSGFKSPFHGP
jgi:hypothetical protein